MKRRTLRRFKSAMFPAVVLAGLAGLSAQPAAAQSFTATNVGVLTGGTDSRALGVGGSASAANGPLVGWSKVTGGDTHAFKYIGTTKTDLGVISGGSDSFATAVNAAGSIAGYGDDGTDIHAWKFPAGGSLTDLGVLTGGVVSRALGINATGHVVGWSEVTGGDKHAFLNKTGTTLIDLDTLGGTDSEALAISNNGFVVGDSHIAADAAKHAFVFYDEDADGVADAGEMVDLGTLGGTNSFATGVNEAGDVVGYSQVFGDAATHAFYYSYADNWMYDLGTLGGTNSYAYGLNNSGQVVGASQIAGNAETHAILWSQGVMYDLNDLSGQTYLQDARSINDAMQIAGYMLTGVGGTDRAYRLTPELSLSSVALKAATAPGGTVVSGTVVLNANAAPWGALVNLWSSNSAVATVPQTVLVAGGKNSATFNVNALAVDANTSVTISAGSGFTKTAALSVTKPALSALKLSVATTVGGPDVIGTVTLSGPAGPAGVVVTLADGGAASTTPPASVTVPAGATTANFTMNTAAVAANATVTISAAYAGVTKTAALAVTNPVPATLTINPATVVGGGRAKGVVTLTGVAPTGGAAVTLADGGAASTTPPATVTVAAGEKTASFYVVTAPIAANAAVTISATRSGISKTAALAVTAPALSAFTLNSPSVTGGTAAIGIVTLTGIAPTGGVVVTLSDGGAASTTPPATVTVPAGATSKSFSITTSAVTVDASVTLSATVGTVVKKVALAVKAPYLLSASLSAATVASTGTVTLTVTLSGNAPVGGVVVTLSSSNTTAATLPATVTILAGASTATATVTAGTVDVNTGVTISAVRGTITKTAPLIVTP